jgi:Tfp pilus assembly protein PilE
MNHFKTAQKGFTGKEFLVVILVIGILCGAAVPLFNSMKSGRLEKQALRFVQVIQRNIEKSKIISHDQSQQTQYPQALDDQPNQQRCLNCFSAVLKKGLSHKLWFKISATEYAFSRNGNFGDDVGKYTEKGDLRVSYDPLKGKLTLTIF